MNPLNQRKSPSAPLVSQEIETDFNRSSFFFQNSRKVPEVAGLSIVAGGGGGKVGEYETSSSSSRVCIFIVRVVAGRIGEFARSGGGFLF